MVANNNIDPQEFLEQAYDLNNSKDSIGFYRRWAAEYDVYMKAMNYLSPETLSEMLAGNLTAGTPQPTPRVLDIGCGTGMTGAALLSHMPCTLDGIDISGEMIEVARSRGIYQNLIVGDLNHPLAIDDNQYDASICTGTFTHGHVGPTPLAEIGRVLKPGGIFAFTVHFDLWHTRKFDIVLADLIGKNMFRCIALEEGSYFEGSGNEGWFCLYQKC